MKWGWKEACGCNKSSAACQTLQGQRKLVWKQGQRKEPPCDLVKIKWSNTEGGESEYVRQPCSKPKEFSKWLGNIYATNPCFSCANLSHLLLNWTGFISAPTAPGDLTKRSCRACVLLVVGVHWNFCVGWMQLDYSLCSRESHGQWLQGLQGRVTLSHWEPHLYPENKTEQ